jgi:hypothetical protein
MPSGTKGSDHGSIVPADGTIATTLLHAATTIWYPLHTHHGISGSRVLDRTNGGHHSIHGGRIKLVDTVTDMFPPMVNGWGTKHHVSDLVSPLLAEEDVPPI